jgi:hypothetical protein
MLCKGIWRRKRGCVQGERGVGGERSQGRGEPGEKEARWSKAIGRGARRWEAGESGELG